MTFSGIFSRDVRLFLSISELVLRGLFVETKKVSTNKKNLCHFYLFLHEMINQN